LLPKAFFTLASLGIVVFGRRLLVSATVGLTPYSGTPTRGAVAIVSSFLRRLFVKFLRAEKFFDPTSPFSYVPEPLPAAGREGHRRTPPRPPLMLSAHCRASSFFFQFPRTLVSNSEPRSSSPHSTQIPAPTTRWEQVGRKRFILSLTTAEPPFVAHVLKRFPSSQFCPFPLPPDSPDGSVASPLFAAGLNRPLIGALRRWPTVNRFLSPFCHRNTTRCRGFLPCFPPQIRFSFG